MNSKIVAATFASAAFSMAANADIAITYSSPGNSAEQMVLSVVGQKASMTIPGPQGGQGRMVYDHAQNKMFVVMDDQQQFMDMDAMVEAMSGLSGMLAGMMENMPEDTQGQLSGILGGLGQGDNAPPPEPVAEETGQTDEVMGISCEITRYTVGQESSEMCLADPDELGISNAEFEVLQGMMAKQQQTAEQASQMLGISAAGFSPGVLDQVPLRVKQLSGPDTGTSSEVTGTSEEVSAASVEIPSNYTPVNMSMLGG